MAGRECTRDAGKQARLAGWASLAALSGLPTLRWLPLLHAVQPQGDSGPVLPADQGWGDAWSLPCSAQAMLPCAQTMLPRSPRTTRRRLGRAAPDAGQLCCWRQRQ